MCGQPAVCMTSGRSLGLVWLCVPGRCRSRRWFWYQVWFGWWRLGPRCGLPGDSSLSGNATWASSVCAAIRGLDTGMWY